MITEQDIQLARPCSEYLWGHILADLICLNYQPQDLILEDEGQHICSRHPSEHEADIFLQFIRNSASLGTSLFESEKCICEKPNELQTSTRKQNAIWHIQIHGVAILLNKSSFTYIFDKTIVSYRDFNFMSQKEVNILNFTVYRLNEDFWKFSNLSAQLNKFSDFALGVIVIEFLIPG